MTKQVEELAEEAIREAESGARLGQDMTVEDLGRFYRVISASCSPQSILMWSHYTKKHSGLVIELETDNIEFKYGERNHLQPVVYRSERAVMPADFYHSDLRDAVLFEVFLTKGLYWAYEEEVRLCVHCGELQPGDSLPISPTVIKRVIVGCKASEQVISKVRSVLTSPDYQHVVPQRAVPHVEEYALVFEDL